MNNRKKAFGVRIEIEALMSSNTHGRNRAESFTLLMWRYLVTFSISILLLAPIVAEASCMGETSIPYDGNFGASTELYEVPQQIYSSRASFYVEVSRYEWVDPPATDVVLTLLRDPLQEYATLGEFAYSAAKLPDNRVQASAATMHQNVTDQYIMVYGNNRMFEFGIRASLSYYHDAKVVNPKAAFDAYDPIGATEQSFGGSIIKMVAFPEAFSQGLSNQSIVLVADTKIHCIRMWYTHQQKLLRVSGSCGDAGDVVGYSSDATIRFNHPTALVAQSSHRWILLWDAGNKKIKKLLWEAYVGFYVVSTIYEQLPAILVEHNRQQATHLALGMFGNTMELLISTACSALIGKVDNVNQLERDTAFVLTTHVLMTIKDCPSMPLAMSFIYENNDSPSQLSYVAVDRGQHKMFNMTTCSNYYWGNTTNATNATNAPSVVPTPAQSTPQAPLTSTATSTVPSSPTPPPSTSTAPVATTTPSPSPTPTPTPPPPPTLPPAPTVDPGDLIADPERAPFCRLYPSRQTYSKASTRKYALAFSTAVINSFEPTNIHFMEEDSSKPAAPFAMKKFPIASAFTGATQQVTTATEVVSTTQNISAIIASDDANAPSFGYYEGQYWQHGGPAGAIEGAWALKAGHWQQYGFNQYSDNTGLATYFGGPVVTFARPSNGITLIIDKSNHCIFSEVRQAFYPNFAGRCGTAGFADGVSGTSMLSNPSAVVITADRMLIADDNGLRQVDKANGAVATLVSLDLSKLGIRWLAQTSPNDILAASECFLYEIKLDASSGKSPFKTLEAFPECNVKLLVGEVKDLGNEYSQKSQFAVVLAENGGHDLSVYAYSSAFGEPCMAPTTPVATTNGAMTTGTADTTTAPSTSMAAFSTAPVPSSTPQPSNTATAAPTTTVDPNDRAAASSGAADNSEQELIITAVVAGGVAIVIAIVVVVVLVLYFRSKNKSSQRRADHYRVDGSNEFDDPREMEEFPPRPGHGSISDPQTTITANNQTFKQNKNQLSTVELEKGAPMSSSKSPAMPSPGYPEKGRRTRSPGAKSPSANGNETWKSDYSHRTMDSDRDKRTSTLDKSASFIKRELTDHELYMNNSANGSAGGGGGPVPRGPGKSVREPELGTSENNEKSETSLSSPSNDFSNVGSDALALKASLVESTHSKYVKLVADGEYIKLKLIGRGAFGSVFSVMMPDGGQIAMKEMPMPSMDPSSFGDIKREVMLVTKLIHPNVVRYYGCRFEEQEMKLLLFMEMASGGSLASICRTASAELPESVGRVYLKQVVSALSFIHSRDVVHRDIKCDNVLLTHDGLCKLGDFGTSKLMQNTVDGGTKAAQTMIGTPLFMAPEMLNDEYADAEEEDANGSSPAGGYTKKADIWSFGILCLELFNKGNPPWPKFNNAASALLYIASGKGSPIIPERLSDSCKDFIGRCIERDPVKRASAAELSTHPWLSEH